MEFRGRKAFKIEAVRLLGLGEKPAAQLALEPGDAVVDDEALLAYAREKGNTIFHPTSTCRMGSDERAVVDERLRVRGIQGLRVADCSIMPTVVSGNTNAPAIMIGEKCSHMVLEDAATG